MTSTGRPPSSSRFCVQPEARDDPLVTEQDAVDLLQSLTSIASPSRNEDQAVRALVEWLSHNGWQAARDEAGNAVGVRGSGENEILLLGHIDTFPGHLPVRRQGNQLYGRGAVDAKGPLCAFACAASQVSVPQDWRITVVGAVEEESTTSRGARHVLGQRPLDRAPRYCIIGEPSRWDRITLGYKGRLHLHVALRYPFSHSAGAGKLPAEAAVELWRAVETFCLEKNSNRPDRQFERLTPSLESLVTDRDGAFGSASLRMGFRLSPDDDPAALPKSLTEVLESCMSDAPAGANLECKFTGAELAHKSSKATSLVRAFLKAVRGAGGDPRFVLKTGTSDMNVVAPGWPDTPIVAYGPGDSALDHTPEEHIELEDYLRAIDVLRAVLGEIVTL